ncbi:hypothetical protein [Pararhizobium antarcticum]|nr:hypothetical protein [Pararhizobium antarcticum]
MTKQLSVRMQLPSRRQTCESEMRHGVRLLVDKAVLKGFTREEALIAISDAADAELVNSTEDLAASNEDIAGRARPFPDIVSLRLACR